jgi:hypothetical protein
MPRATRTRGLGIRAALGATASRRYSLFLREVLVFTAAGIDVGTPFLPFISAKGYKIEGSPVRNTQNAHVSNETLERECETIRSVSRRPLP